MRKQLRDNELCRHRREGGRDGRIRRLGFGAAHGRYRVRAFTVVELVVAVGILALMMALAGQVFSIAVKSTGQATALTHVSQRMRKLEQTLREDLAHVRPDTSLLVIQGNPIKAYWTAAGRDADIEPKNPLDGYPHLADPEREVDLGGGVFVMTPPRADVLMFVTQRRAARSTVYTDVTGNAQQVVYGHALQTEYRRDPNTSTGFRSGIDPNWYDEEVARQFPIVRSNNNAPAAMRPASDWHLARRAVLLTNLPVPRNSGWGDTIPVDEGPNDDGDFPLLSGLTDVVGSFKYEEVLKPAPWPPTRRRRSGDWLKIVDGKTVYDLTTDYRARSPWVQRGILDVTPPAPIANRLGQYLLPNCASFKVEWTIDPAVYDTDTGNVSLRGGGDRVLWFDSDDSLNQSGPNNIRGILGAELKRLEDLANQADPPSRTRYLRRRIQLQAVLNVVNPDTRFPNGNNGNLADVPGLFWFPRVVKVSGGQPVLVNGRLVTAPDPLFPRALRITVDVFDENLRLDRPIRHVMVIPLGS